MRAGIGYELARPFWRQGIMTEALAAIIDLGFYNEGLLKEYENWGSKGFVDLCMLSILRRVWKISWSGMKASSHWLRLIALKSWRGEIFLG
jgi:RimJ/RimL family protein N-acetyltransferase